MKKVFSIISLVFSIISIVFIVFVGALCIYDIKINSANAFAGSYDMWYALRVYPKILIPSAFMGLFTTLMYMAFSTKGEKKVAKAVVFIFFIIITIAAFVLRYFCYRDF